MTEKPEIFARGRFPDPTEELLEQHFNVHWERRADDRARMLADIGPRIRAIATTSAQRTGGDLLDHFPNLEILSTFSVGYEHVDIPAARSRKILVTNTPDVLNECVADFAIGQTIMLLRRMGEGERYLRAGQWPKGAFPLGAHLGGRTLGLYGLGGIGSRIATRATAFGMKIAYRGRRRRPEYPDYAYHDTLVGLAKACDVLIAVLHPSPETIGSINAEVLEALGPKGYLINVARASIVDRDALLHALQNKTIAGAAIDVFWNEPNADTAFFDLERVVLTPHQGGASVETRAAMGRLMVDNLLGHFSGQGVLTPVS